jgi:guanylate kinase
MNTKGNRKGKVVVISGPSGVGKSTICKGIVKKLDNVCLSVSATTRPRAENEADGKDYCFLTKSEFQEKIDAGQFLEYAEVFGNFYGTPRDKVRQNLKAGKTVILEIDVQGGTQIKTAFPDAVMIFIMPPDRGELAKRMSLRAREEPQTAEKRLKKAGSEIAAANRYYDYKVVNDNLQDAVNKVIKIINAAK